MASKDGGGGALGWTLLGFLAGIAATLAAETLLSGNGHQARPEASVTPITTIDAEPAAPPSPVVHPTAAAVSSHSASPPAAAANDETADDAAAAGMTSRVQPSTDDSSASHN